MTITQAELKRLLRYEPDTGQFFWLVSTSRVSAGASAGTLHKHGCIHIGINRRVYKAHRLAWLYMTGELPHSKIDHEDRNPGNNKWKNLRLASQRQNCHNRSRRSDNTTGFKGVGHHRNGGYRAAIWIHGKRHSLGHFDTAEAAHEAYVAAAKEAFGEFFCAG